VLNYKYEKIKLLSKSIRNNLIKKIVFIFIYVLRRGCGDEDEIETNLKGYNILVFFFYYLSIIEVNFKIFQIIKANQD